MRIKLDMHVHSEKSFDSRQSIDEIVAECKKKKIDGVCICDHNVAATEMIVRDGILILPGIEIATDHGHLLGYLIDDDVKPVHEFPIACERIHAANGVAVLAHPFERKRDARETVDRFVDSNSKLFDGIETQNARAAQFVPRAAEYAIFAAERNHMRTFGGSDAHITHEIGNAYTEIELDVDSIEKITPTDLRKALLEDDPTACMRRQSKRINTVKSQYIRMKKTNAGVKRWCKYFIYAAKCILLDTVKPMSRLMRKNKCL